MAALGGTFITSLEHRLRERIDSLNDALERERRDHARAIARLELKLAGAQTDARSLKQQIRWMERTKHHHA